MWGMEQMPAALAQKSNYHHVLKLEKTTSTMRQKGKKEQGQIHS